MLAKKAAEFQMPALALTDQGNLHGTVDFFKECQAVKIKPIIGCELFVAPTSRHEKKKISGEKPGYPIVLLVKNSKGYKNLCKLSSIAYLEGFYYTPRIDKELLEEHKEGLICLSGPMQGKIAQLLVQERDTELEEEISFFRELFGEDFYLEITRHHMTEEAMKADGMDRETWLWQASLDFQEKQEMVAKRLISLSKEKNIPLVATNDSRYMDREDWKGHEILMNISSGEPCEIWERDSQGNPKNRVLNPKRRVKLSHELYFKSPSQMRNIFSDCLEAVEETEKIAAKCQFELDFTSKFYPVFIPPHLEGTKYTAKEREKEAEKYLRKLCHDGVEKRYTKSALEKIGEKFPSKDPKIIVEERLAYELDLITSKGLCDYLLIVYDFIAWAKNKGIPVGPGRGSGAGSIVCFLTGITDIEPLRFNLFFERFINPERVSYPDIDVDICMDRRSEVIDYTIQKYGKDNVAQIITFGTMKAKMAVKDVGRVLSVPLSKVNHIAKLIPEDPNMTLEKALEIDPELRNEYEQDEETKRLIDRAKTLEGSVRNTGIHAAGLIVSADPLMEHIPICNAKDESVVVTQYAMKPVEAVGMLKIDFLGLKTLTAIQLAVDAIKESKNITIDWENLSLEDGPTFALLNQGKTLGIFQLESAGMQELAKQLHIDKFEEICAVGALYRPGPMEMIPSYINRKHGREKIEFDHPMMKDILEETYGIMVYQEQVMMMAQKIAGYSLGAGDMLRKAMGKKDREEMARQKEKFRRGAIENGIDEQTAIIIFDKVEKFASYGFNKPHATAYGYLTYVTAFLKANYPLHWMAALMTTDRDDLTKITKIIRECQAMQISILPPDVNESGIAFVATQKGIRFAMTAVKGVGEGVVKVILEERSKNGLFDSLYDFIHRIDTQKIGKKVIECLIEAGAFDFTGWKREALIASVEPIYQESQKQQREKARGELNFFSLLDEDNPRFAHPPDVPPLSRMDILKREKELLGFYLTGHPLDDVQDTLQKLSCLSLEQIDRLDKGAICRAAFVVESVSIRYASRTGKKFAVLTIGDSSTRFELPIWSDLFEEKGHLLVENQLLYTVLQVDRDDEGATKLICRWFDDLTRADPEMVRECDLAYDRARMQAKMSSLRSTTREKKAIEKKSEKKEAVRKLVLRCDADKMKLSQILAIKDIFRSFTGMSSVEIEFLSNNHVVGKILIDKPWGVELSLELKSRLEKLEPVIDILAESG